MSFKIQGRFRLHYSVLECPLKIGDYIVSTQIWSLILENGTAVAVSLIKLHAVPGRQVRKNLIIISRFRRLVSLKED